MASEHVNRRGTAPGQSERPLMRGNAGPQSELQSGTAQLLQLGSAVGNQAMAGMLQRREENRTGLPDHLKANMEQLGGVDLSDVRVNTNSSRPREVDALAYAQGNQIHIAPGQEQHLPHEAWHIVQQKQGRVRPTSTLAGGQALNDDPGLEREADRMGDQANRADVASGIQQQVSAAPLRGAGKLPIQRILTRAESVAGDLMHRERDNMFSPDMLDEYKNILRHRYPTKEDKEADLVDSIQSDRFVDYNQLSTDTLKNARDLTKLAGNGAEHMYIHLGGTIHRADRTSEKLPHPTLAGGDPDVTSAGTLEVSSRTKKETVDEGGGWKSDKNVTHYTVAVTTESGHFRPASVPKGTLDKVKAAAATNPPATGSITVVEG
ncbi:DUF4157 domain-containing protein [Paenibacillus sp. IB182496]|uniref:DUF4157 domain-containing protein n=1 Tax=Paenibacillus sabuli TaxID=2772509 RepID=A0A927BXP8_9BACL|nr:DUF4157 domain-containing protein [Paenibacillus sabuli]MBD2847253.1 DUF4157 domain-containing protein [Paenibacillus sabuli]